MSETKSRTIKILGQEWCKPVSNARLIEYVCVGYGDRWLALCRVEQDMNTGEIRRIMIKPDELTQAGEGWK